ncbi:HNH endonuclease [Clostridium akagii]|uniref:HNH endonuclease n=1 Tax=Clostridium akagii TaxID=91623 RepID=UPI000A011F29|nr:hypothetical protein [Clostridium akagii]
MKNNYKTIENEYEFLDSLVLIKILKKDGTPLTTKIDKHDLDKVKKMGVWFAEWHKDFNSYLVQNISEIKANGKSEFIKQNLQSVIMDTNSKATIRYINGDTLDNRRENLEIFNRNTRNDFEPVDENTVALILKDKYGKPEAKALISKEDLSTVLNDTYGWIYDKVNGNLCVVTNTPHGRVYLDKILMKPEENFIVHHINLNPLDNRRVNLEVVAVV